MNQHPLPKTDSSRRESFLSGRYRYLRLRWRLAAAALDLCGWGFVLLCRAALWTLRGMGPARTDQKADFVPRRILLVQPDHLGDAVLSTVLSAGLKRRYPDARIDVLCGEWNREFFLSLPEVEDVHVWKANRFDRRRRRWWLPGTLLCGWRLRRRRYDLAIDPRGDPACVLILWLCGARRRLGWSNGGGGFLLSDSLRRPPGGHEVDSRLALLDKLGIPPSEDPRQNRPRFVPTAGAQKRITRLLAELDLPVVESAPIERDDLVWSRRMSKRDLSSRLLRAAENSSEVLHGAGYVFRPEQETAADDDARRATLVVLHIGAGTPAKTWPKEHWRELLGRLLIAARMKIVLVGSGDEQPASRDMLEGKNWPNVWDWTGQLNVDELGALLKNADVFVGGDSGPAHLAAAVGTRTVVLFSGAHDPEQWRPLGGKVRILRREVACGPCRLPVCPVAGHPCMSKLTPREAVEAILESAAGGAVKPRNEKGNESGERNRTANERE